MMKEILTEWRNYLAEQDTVDLPEPGEKAATTATQTALQKADEQPHNYHPTGIAGFFIDISNAVKRGTGIRILDPSAPKIPPKWARENPALYATFQTAADLFLSDPFSAALMFVPTGKLGAAGIAALERAGLENLAAQASKPVSQVIIEQSPKKVAEILNILKNTEVKTVVSNYWQNLSKLNQQDYEKVISGGINYAEAFPGAQNFVKAARQTVRQAAAGQMSRYAQIVSESVVDKKLLIIASEDGVRPVVVLDTQYGRVPFYRSTGQSTPGVKLEGEWHIFGGIKPHKQGFSFFMKNKNSVGLTNGQNEYLTKISLALEESWKNETIQSSTNRINLSQVAESNLEHVNKAVQNLNKKVGTYQYEYYNKDLLQEAYLNSYLRQMGALEESGLAKSIDNTDYFVGLKDMPSFFVKGSNAKAKTLLSLPSLFK